MVDRVQEIKVFELSGQIPITLTSLPYVDGSRRNTNMC